ncbi:MAG TPA: Trm112 family protein [Pseudomonadota bacterium]|nr:Trm112 family protein [Pseudomonadota bacterium]
MLNPELMAILRCPKCRGELQEKTAEKSGGSDGGTALVCAACELSYAIEDGIPNLLIEEARPSVAA